MEAFLTSGFTLSTVTSLSLDQTPALQRGWLMSRRIGSSRAQGELEGRADGAVQAKEKIRAIFTFPGGWLIEEEEGDETMDTRDGGREQRRG